MVLIHLQPHASGMDSWQIHLRIRSSWRTNESQKLYNSSQVYSPTSAQRSAANGQRSRPFLLLQNEAVLKEQNHSMPMLGPVGSSALQFCGWILFMKRALWCCYLQPLCRMHKSLCSILWKYSSQRSDSLVLNCVINVCVCVCVHACVCVCVCVCVCINRDWGKPI